MSKKLTSVDTVEHELQELREGIRSSLDTLKKIGDVQRHALRLSETNAQTKALLEEMSSTFDERRQAIAAALENVDAHLRTSSDRFAKLEERHDAKWTEAESRLEEHRERLEDAQEATSVLYEALKQEFEGTKEALEARLDRLDEAERTTSSRVTDLERRFRSDRAVSLIALLLGLASAMAAAYLVATGPAAPFLPS